MSVPPDTRLADLQSLLDAANKAKHDATDLSMVIWHAGRANAFAQVLASASRDCSDGEEGDR